MEELANDLEARLYSITEKLEDGVWADVTNQEQRDELKKVNVSIQGDSLRVTGKNKDDLQSAIQLLKEQDIEVPLQFQNYR